MQYVKNTIVDNLLGLVAPHLCSGCGKTGRLLCNDCKYDIINRVFNGCVLCMRPSRDGICLWHVSSFHLAHVVGIRTSALQRLIGGFKFKNMKSAAKDLAGLLDATLPVLPEGTIIVPIPTAPAHIRERGYDHMLLVAQWLSVMRRLPLSRVLQRQGTATQHKAGREVRLEQARSAFRVDGVVEATTYLLLDDVITTGATIIEASKTLMEAGAREVIVGAIARQPLD